ncbi:MAG: PAS domain-containing protein [Rhodocyclaceae bacterium]|nr:PAS domain-containing protein [Rhodocyclaceae bacterium]
MESEIMWLGLVALGGGLAVALIGLVYLLLRLREAETRLHEKEDQHQGILDRLQENEYRLRTIIESEPECVKLQAADGTVLEINPAGLRLIDAGRPEDIIGRKIYEVVAPEYQAIYRENMRRVFAGESVVYEFRSTTLKGRTCWMETHAVPLRDARGEVLRAARHHARHHRAQVGRGTGPAPPDGTGAGGAPVDHGRNGHRPGPRAQPAAGGDRQLRARLHPPPAHRRGGVRRADRTARGSVRAGGARRRDHAPPCATSCARASPG